MCCLIFCNTSHIMNCSLAKGHRCFRFFRLLSYALCSMMLSRTGELILYTDFMCFLTQHFVILCTENA